MKKTFSIVEFAKPNDEHGGYKYLIEEFGFPVLLGNSAFKTDRGFRQFCDVHKASKPYRVSKFADSKSKGRIYFIDCDFDIVIFWKSSDVPKGAKEFVALCNGSYVKHYYIVRSDGSHLIYKPNPNAKSVYRPMDYFLYSDYIG